MDGDRTPPERRLTVGEAAEILGITAEAVRSRIKRGTLESVKDRNTVYVLLSPDQTTHKQRPGDAQTADQTRRDTLINMLREQVAYLQSVIATRDEELARRDEEIRRRDAALEREQQLTAMFAERLWVIEAPREEPSEPRESPVTFRVGRERADPGEEARGQVEPTERPRQRSSWRAPVDKLPLWQYLLGLGLIAGLLLVLTLDFFYKLDPAGIRTYLFWAVPAMFGFWVGLKRRHLSLWRNLFPIGLMVGATAAVATVPIQGTTGYSSLVEFSLSIILFIFVPTLMLYISGAIIGRALQRRTAGAYASLTQDTEAPPSAPRHRTLGDRWSPRKQAILGFSGTVVAALVSVVGQIVVAGMGGGG